MIRKIIDFFKTKYKNWKAKRDLKRKYPESKASKRVAAKAKKTTAAKKKVEDRIAKHFGTKRVPGGKMGVKEEKDAFAYVVAKLKKQHGDGVLTKGDKIKPPSASIPVARADSFSYV